MDNLADATGLAARRLLGARQRTLPTGDVAAVYTRMSRPDGERGG